MPAALQREVIDGRIAAVEVEKAVLVLKLQEAEFQGGSATNPLVIALDEEIAALRTQRGRVQDYFITMPYATVTIPGKSGGVAFSTFTYEKPPEHDPASTSVGITKKDPTQIVLWGKATHENVYKAFKGLYAPDIHLPNGRVVKGELLETYTRPPDNAYRWEDDDPDLAKAIKEAVKRNSFQWIAMKNSTDPTRGEWVWVRSTGLQARGDVFLADDRHHFRFFSSDTNPEGSALGKSIDSEGNDLLGHWTVIAAHYERRVVISDFPFLSHRVFTEVEATQRSGWDEGQERVVDSITIPLVAGKRQGMPWVKEIERRRWGNNGVQQGVNYTLQGYLIKMGDPDETTLRAPSKPAAPALMTRQNTITVTKPGEDEADGTWFEYQYQGATREIANSEELGYDGWKAGKGLVVSGNLAIVVAEHTVIADLKYETKYQVRVRTYNARGRSDWSEPSTITTEEAPPTCDNGTVVKNPNKNANRNLVADCVALLTAKKKLEGKGAAADRLTLNWSEDLEISTWDGIELTDNNRRVMELELLGYSDPGYLKGVIPAELGQLTGLQTLVLSGHQLSGPIPAALGKLVKLQRLTLDWNQLTGSIPEELKALEALERLELNGNQLRGIEFPAALIVLENLDILKLAPVEEILRDDPWTGCIPPSLRQVASNDLASLSLPDCSATKLCMIGKAVPSPATNPGLVADCAALLTAQAELGAAPALNWSPLLRMARWWQGVHVGDTTNAVGVKVKRVRSLRLEAPVGNPAVHAREPRPRSEYRGKLSGSIPAALGDLTELRELALQRNSLSGEIPAELGQLSKLQVLTLQQNKLGGHIPPELENLTRLTNLKLKQRAGYGYDGCIPAGLYEVAKGNRDLGRLSIERCPATEVSIASVATPVKEGQKATFTVTRTGSTAEALVVLVRVTDGDGDFLDGDPPTSVTIAADATSATLEVRTKDDEEDEEHGRVTATIRISDDYAVDQHVGSAWVAVEDNDLPVVRITGGAAVEEGADAVFTVTREGLTTEALTVLVSVTDGDHEFLKGTPDERVTIAAGEASARLEVETADDAVGEKNGAVTVTLGASDDYEIAAAAASATVAVEDNDVVVRIAGGAAVEEGQKATFTVTRTGSTAAALTVAVSVTDGEHDFLKGTPAASVTIAAGATSATLAVATENDEVDEPNGLVTATLGASASDPPLYTIDAAAGAATVTVRDNDVPPCENGTAVSNPRSNRGLVADCTALLAARDALRGTATLNWSADRPIGGWEGVRVGAGRVLTLNLPRKGLTGVIPASLGSLERLISLSLENNQLTGSIPAELGRLGRLRALVLTNNRLTGSIPAELARPPLSTLWLRGNALTGCVPPSLREVGRHDLASLNLPDCLGFRVQSQTFTTSGNAGYAKAGDVITAAFTTSAALAQQPGATIAGQAVTVMGAGTSWSAAYTVTSDARNGQARFDLGEIRDGGGNRVNPPAAAMGIVIDTVSPRLTAGRATSSGGGRYAKAGDVIRVSFTVSETPAAMPEATIAGRPATVSGSDRSWVASLAVTEATVNGAAVFDAAAVGDRAGNRSGDPVAVTTVVTVDTVAPTATLGTVTTTAAAGDPSGVGDTITVPFTTSEALAVKPWATIAGKVASISGSGTSWTATYTVEAGVNAADAGFDLGPLRDAAGNTNDPASVPTGVRIKTPVMYLLSTSVSPPEGGSVRVVVVRAAQGSQADFISQPREWGPYGEGTEVKAIARANAGYRFQEWSGGVCEGVTDPHTVADGCLITMNAAGSVTAIFAKQCTLTVRAGTGGSASGSWRGDCGTERPITATARSGYAFDGWRGAPVADATAASTTVLVDGNLTVTAGFQSTGPTVEELSFTTSNPRGYGDVAKAGDVITARFTTSAALASKPAVTIAGRPARVTGSGTSWTATITVTSGTRNGLALFDVGELRDREGNTSDPGVEATFIVVDTVAPRVTSHTFSSSNGGATAGVGETITVSFTTSEDLAEWPAATIAGQAVRVSGLAGAEDGEDGEDVEGEGEEAPEDGEEVEGEGGTVRGEVRNWTVTYTVTSSTPRGTAMFDLGVIRDRAGNATNPVAVSTGIGIGNSAAPAVVTTSATTSGNAGYAKAGDTITVAFTTSKALASRPAATIAGRPATVTGSGTSWRAAYRVTTATPNGAAQFALGAIRDRDGNSGTPAAVATGIVVDTVAPTATLGTARSSSGTTTAAAGDVITVPFTTSEALALKPWATIAGKVASISGSGTSWTATYTVEAGVNAANAGLDLGTLRDAAGNTNDPASVPTGIAVKTGASRYTLSTSVSPPGSGGVRVVVVRAAQGTQADFISQPRKWGPYVEGTEVKAIARANADYRFGQWSGGVCEGVTDPYTVADGCRITMDAAGSVTAIFVPQCEVTGTALPGGRVTGGATVDCGQTVTLTATADAGHCFNRWIRPPGSAGVSGQQESCATSVVLPVRTAAGTPKTYAYTAVFYVKLAGQCTLTVEAGAGGSASGTWTGTCGTERPITATPAADYRFASWSGGSGVNDRSAASTTVVVSSDMTVRANFQEQCSLTVNDNTGGTGSGSWRGDCGTTRPIRASASTDYVFARWTVAGSPVASATAAATTVKVDVDTTVTPTFDAQCSVTVTAGTGGSVDPTSGTVDCGQPLEVTITATDGYCFESVTGGLFSGQDDGVEGQQQSCQTRLTGHNLHTAASETPAAYSYLVNFRAKEAVAQCTLTVEAGDGGSAGTTWRGDCGTERPLTATPAAKYRFGAWSGGSGVRSRVSASTTVVVSSDMTVTATFVARCSLTVSAGVGGTVSGGGTVDCGRTLTATATAGGGYCFDGWDPSLGGLSGQQSCLPSSTLRKTTTRGVPVDFVYLATFRVKESVAQCTLTVEAGDGGSAGTTWRGDCGTERPLTATPAAKYRFGAWSGGSGVRSRVSASTTVVVSSDMTVTATFVARCSLTVSAGPGGSVSGGGTVDCGRTLTATATAGGGYCFDGWDPSLGGLSGQQSCLPSSTLRKTTTRGVPVDFVYLATFRAKPTYTLTVTADTGGTPSGGGSGLASGSTATGGVSWNNVRYSFTGWGGDPCTTTRTLSTSSSCSVTMTSNKAIHAKISKRFCTVAARAGTGGSASGGGTVHCGVGSTSVRAQASVGYCFSKWTGETARTSSCLASHSLSVVRPQLSLTYTASFRAQNYRLTVNNGSGSGTYGARSYANASAPAWICQFGYRYNFSGWTGTSVTSRSVRVYMNRDRSLTANFATRTTMQCFSGSDAAAAGDGATEALPPPVTEPLPADAAPHGSDVVEDVAEQPVDAEGGDDASGQSEASPEGGSGGGDGGADP